MSVASVLSALSGVYQLDKSLSESIEPFLAAVGAPWIARKAAAKVSAETTIRVLSADEVAALPEGHAEVASLDDAAEASSAGGAGGAAGGAADLASAPAVSIQSKSTFRTKVDVYRIGAGIVNNTTRPDGSKGKAVAEVVGDALRIRSAGSGGGPVVESQFALFEGDPNRLHFRIRFFDDKEKYAAGDAKVDVNRHSLRKET